ncbi:segregation/condensation protein A [Tissierella creatinini]|nr:segregation/condensation protein A [Tissierella creatinini]TJX69107.1 segregation/condensation protein A [Soehngenia saccharolytica]
MGYKVELEAYEGPLDLLLSLIQKNEIDIYDIPINMITEQFLESIKDMEELNLEVTSEFLLMAATLLEIKSKMLLPKEKIVEEGVEIEIDPREVLVQRLIEYKLYKEAAEKLKISELIESRVYYKPREDLSIYKDPFEELSKIDLSHLVKAISNIIAKNSVKHNRIDFNEISRQEYTLDICIDEIRTRLKLNKNILFSQLLSSDITREEIVTYFLSLLELIKMKKVYVEQDSAFTDLTISWRLDEDYGS